MKTSYAVFFSKFRDVLLDMGKTDQVGGGSHNLRVVKDFFKGTTRGKVDDSREQIMALMPETLGADNFEIYYMDGSISDNVS